MSAAAGPGEELRGVDDPVQSPDELASVVAVVDPQQQVRPDIRRWAARTAPRPGCRRAPVSALSVAVTVVTHLRIASGARGAWAGPGWVPRGRESACPAGLAGVVDPVPDDRSVPGVDQLGEQRVDDVVVQGAAAAGPVRFAATGGEFDLQVRPVFGVGLGDVDDEEVGEDQVGQRVVLRSRRAASPPLPSRPSQNARLAFSRAL